MDIFSLTFEIADFILCLLVLLNMSSKRDGMVYLVCTRFDYVFFVLNVLHGIFFWNVDVYVLNIYYFIR